MTRLARALWSDDPQPIDPTPRKEGGKVTGYLDPRMERLNACLTRSELTQCARAVCALRYQDRTVVTFCSSDIDYLPATETITELPQLLSDGRERWAASRAAERAKLDQAREQLEQQGKTLDMISVRELLAVSGVATDAAADYLRQARQQHTPQCCQTETPVPDHATESFYSETRYRRESEAPPRVVQPETATASLVVSQPCRSAAA